MFKDGEAHKFLVSSGTITVNADSTAQILAEEAAPLDHFDLGNAQKALDAANAALGSAGGFFVRTNFCREKLGTKQLVKISFRRSST